ncbi:MAG: endolytic transglycosylase MltG [Anaerotardibacter sp.]
MNRRNVTYSKHASPRSRAVHARGAREFSRYDTSAIRPKRSKAPFVLGALIVVLLVVIGVFAFNCSGGGHNENLLPEGESVRVEIENGSTTDSISDALYDKGVIDNKKEFVNTVKAKNAASSLKPGIYLFTGGMSYDQVVDALVAGPQSTGIKLVVSEGATIKSIAPAVEEAYAGSITADEFLSAANNASKFVDEFPFVADAYQGSLEGFLFPKTYEVVLGYTADDVIRQMLEQYKKETSVLDYSYAESQGLSQYQVLILASIIEKEGTVDTYSRVSAVFYNRLTTDGEPAYGLLGSDATTAYELGGDVEGYDWSTDSPYNTRVHKGLCPSPIASPSIEALRAACSPAEGFEDYYFFSFWPNNNGTVDYYFDKTYEDHKATIAAHS